MNTFNLLVTLDWMWRGMLSLFVCMGIIAGATVLIKKIIKPKKD